MAKKKDYPVSKLKPGNSPTTDNMVGNKYGRLLVLSYLGDKIAKNGHKTPVVLAKCDCGSIHNYISAKLRTGWTKSCGCFQAENTSVIHVKHGHKSPKYGNRGTILYSRWRAMFDRVRSDPNYANVKICDRWKGENGFVNFCLDMGEMPSPKHTVDRYPIIRGNYEPNNVRWATQREQMQNVEKNVNVNFRGEILCITEIARRVGVDRRRLHTLYKEKNFDIEDAINYINKNKK